MKEWLEDCNKYHDHCSTYDINEDPKLPARILDVRDRQELRLHCIEKEERGKYIALSHCWGKAKTFSTIKGNFSSLREGINFDQLPKTFQDAIEVTQQLGIAFLWIDSLCIIQDDKGDWKCESRCMQSVFAGAYCTIAATSAKDSTEGFLDGKVISACVDDSNAESCFTRDVENGLLNQ